MLASLVQVFGEDEAFRYMKALNANVSSYARSGIGPMTAVKRGEIYVGSTVLHGVINEIVAGFPVKPVLPCEGVGYEVGSMAIIKGARNLDAAKKFYDWALTAEAQKIGLDVKEYAIPTNRSVAAAAEGAQAHRHQGHQLRLREVRLERDAQAPARALGEGDQRKRRDDERDARRRDRAVVFWLAVGAVGLPARALVRAAGQRVRCWRWIAHFAAQGSRARAGCRRARTVARWLCAAGRAARRRRAAAGAGPRRRTARANALIAVGAAGFLYLLRPGLRDRPDGLVCRVARPAAAGARRRGQYGMGLGAALVVASFAMLFALGLAGARLLQGRRLRRRQRRRGRVAGRRVHVLPGVPDPDLGARGRQRRVLAVGVPGPPRSPRRSGAWAASPASTRCGVAWNTLVLALLCATGCTALGLAFALIVTRTGLPAQEAAAHPDGAADHHAAVRHRPRPHPDLRPLRPRQPVRSSAPSASSPAAGSTACRACCSRRCSRSRRSPSSC